MSKAILEIKNLSVKFGKKQVLRDVSFEVNEGEFVSIIGPNGAGKSTLLRAIIKIVGGNDSSIKVDGKLLNEYRQVELARIVSYLPQAEQGASYPFTVKEFISMGRYPHIGLFRPFCEDDKKAVQEAMKMTDVKPFENRLIGSLSGGERQKALLAGALAQSAKLMLLDEATTYLDPKHMVEIKETLRRLNSELGTTLISVTHDINMAVNSSDRIIALKNGKISFNGDVKSFLAGNQLKNIYEKDFTLIDNPKSDRPFVMLEWE